MHNRPCAAQSCKSMATGFSTMCSNHRNTKRRHGHHFQASIPATRLAPYLRQVQARQRANSNSEAWSILDKRWSLLVEDATRTLQVYQAGATSIRHHVQAAEQVRNLNGLNNPTAVVNIVLAMHMMLVAEPRVFLSDAAFDFQLVRRVRSLVPMNVGTYWNDKEKRTKRVYRDLPPRVVAILARQLKSAFGGAGYQLADIEARTVDPREVERQRLAEALEALQ